MLKVMKKWEVRYHEAIMLLAKDIKAKYIVYYKDSFNTTPKEFIKYLSNTFTTKEIYLVKTGNKKKRYLESFGSRNGSRLVKPEGLVTGYVQTL